MAVDWLLLSQSASESSSSCCSGCCHWRQEQCISSVISYSLPM